MLTKAEMKQVRASAMHKTREAGRGLMGAAKSSAKPAAVGVGVYFADDYLRRNFEMYQAKPWGAAAFWFGASCLMQKRNPTYAAALAGCAGLYAGPWLKSLMPVKSDAKGVGDAAALDMPSDTANADAARTSEPVAYDAGKGTSSYRPDAAGDEADLGALYDY